MSVNVKGVELLNTGLTFCNYFHIATNIIILIVSIGSIIATIYRMTKYNNANGVVTSIGNSENGECLNRPIYRSKRRINSMCRIGVNYNVDNKDIDSLLDYRGYLEDYQIGGNIDIMYNKNDYYDISKKQPSIIILIMCIIVLVLTAIGTYLRIYRKDNSLVQFWIGMSCFRTFFSKK